MFAGLKKCSPITSSGREVAAAIRSISSVEVLLASIAPSRHTRSSVENTSSLMAMVSNTASMTRSASASAAKSSISSRRDNCACICVSVCRPLLTAAVSDFSIVARPRSRPCRSLSSRDTSRPASRQLSAMPAPMVPAPITAILLISRTSVSFGTSGTRATCRSAKNKCRIDVLWLESRQSRNSSRSLRIPSANDIETAASTHCTILSGAAKPRVRRAIFFRYATKKPSSTSVTLRSLMRGRFLPPIFCLANSMAAFSNSSSVH